MPNATSDTLSLCKQPRLSRHAAGNVFWSGTEAAVSGMLSLVAAFVIARLIGPSEFGTAATAVVVHVLLWVAANALFADALVQRPSVDNVTAVSATCAATTVGVLCALLQLGVGPALASGMHDPRLVPMCAVLAVPLPLVGAAGAMQGLLTRERAYRALAMRTLIGQGAATAVGVIAARWGGGAWAPILQQATGSALGALALLIQRGIPLLRAPCGWILTTAKDRRAGACGSAPTDHAQVLSGDPSALVLRWQPVRELLQVGLPLTVSTLVVTARYRLFVLVLAGTADSRVLGETHMAFRLIDTVRELMFTALWRLTLPILSELQSDPVALRMRVDRLLRMASLALLPLCGVMPLVMLPAVRLLLGPGWEPAGMAALPLAILMGLLLLMFPSGVALVACGQIGQALVGNLGYSAAVLLGVAVLRPASAPGAALVWLGAHLLVVPYSLWVNGRALGTGPLRPLRAGVPAAGLTLAGLVAATSLSQLAAEAELLATAGDPLHEMGLRLVVFAVSMLPGVWLVVRGRAPVQKHRWLGNRPQ